MPLFRGAPRTEKQKLLFNLFLAVSVITAYVVITCAAWFHAANLKCSPTQPQIPGANNSFADFRCNFVQDKPSPTLTANVLGDPYYAYWLSPPFETSTDDTFTPPPAADYTSFPKQKRWDYDIQPYVDRGTALLEAIDTHCTWPTFYWDYVTLEDDGYEIEYHQGEFSDTWDPFLRTIGVAPFAEVINWGCSRPTNRLDSDGNVMLDGGIAIQLNLQAGIMVMTYTYRPMEAPPGIIINLSDIVYLAWQEMASSFAPGQSPLPKYFLVQGIANMETINIVRACIGDSGNQFSVTVPPWPGRLWSMQERCGKALLGSPSGRALGFLLAQHLEVPEGATGAEEAIPMEGVSITAVRVFDVENSEMNLVFYLGQSQQPQKRGLVEAQSENKATSKQQTAQVLHAKSAPYNGHEELSRREIAQDNDPKKPLEREQKRTDPYDYSRWLQRGERVLEAIRSHCAEPSPWTDGASLQTSGYTEELWETTPDTGTWAGFLTQEGIDRDFEFSQVNIRRQFDVDPFGREDFDGRYQFLFDLHRGVFLLTLTYRAINPDPNTVVNLSDILYLAWKRDLMRNLITDGDIKYYLVEDVVNRDTKSTIEALCAWPIPRWPGKDFDMESNCGKALLGSPSGIALGYLLAQHQEDFPDKEIGYVRIFDNTEEGWPNLIFYLGPAGNLPRPSGRGVSGSSSGSSLGGNANRSVSSLSKRITLYDGCRNRGQNFIDAINNQDTCPLPPTQFPDYSALAAAGYHAQLTDYFADPVWKKFLEEVGGDGRTRMLRWKAFREVSAGPPVEDVMLNDGQFVIELHLELGILMMENTYRAINPTPNTVKQLSDIVFLGWQHVALERGVLNPTIKWFLVDSVVNTMTDRVVIQALATKGRTNLDPYPGVTFSVDDADGGAAFYAILGTPSGRGLAWMIINHASRLPHKTIQSARVFRCSTGGSLLCMIFKVVDMPTIDPGLGDASHPPALVRELGMAALAA